MLVDLTAQLDRTERLLRQLLEAKIGRKSEQLSREQLTLFAAELGMNVPESDESTEGKDDDPPPGATGENAESKPRGRKPCIHLSQRGDCATGPDSSAYGGFFGVQIQLALSGDTNPVDWAVGQYLVRSGSGTLSVNNRTYTTYLNASKPDNPDPSQTVQGAGYIDFLDLPGLPPAVVNGVTGKYISANATWHFTDTATLSGTDITRTMTWQLNIRLVNGNWTETISNIQTAQTP